MYSAHDMTLLAIMNGLNMTNFECVYDSYFNKNVSLSSKYFNCETQFPRYTANIILELYKNKTSKINSNKQ